MRINSRTEGRGGTHAGDYFINRVSLLTTLFFFPFPLGKRPPSTSRIGFRFVTDLCSDSLMMMLKGGRDGFGN